MPLCFKCSQYEGKYPIKVEQVELSEDEPDDLMEIAKELENGKSNVSLRWFCEICFQHILGMIPPELRKCVVEASMSTFNEIIDGANIR